MELNLDFDLEVLRITIGCLGAFFLYNEVKEAHKVESLHSIKEKLEKQIADPTTTTNKLLEVSKLLNTTLPPEVNAKRELLIQHELATHSNPDEDQTRKWYGSFNNDLVNEMYDNHINIIKLQFAALRATQDNLKKLNKVAIELHTKTSERSLKNRIRYLNFGFFLIVFSFIIDLVIQFLHKA